VPAAVANQIESNVSYGLYSMLELWMEVYYPERSNGLGVVFISGIRLCCRSMVLNPSRKG
jgi:hypothetical protein